jgi:hypothetical protein
LVSARGHVKTRLLGLGTLAVCLAVVAACAKKPGATGGGGQKTDKLITIQAGGTLGCEVDFPVAVVYIGKHYPRWMSSDNEYWIHFVGGSGSPFSVDPIDVPPHGKSAQFDIVGQPNYYTYEIWNQRDSASNTHSVCKNANDDRDTGLNVKR